MTNPLCPGTGNLSFVMGHMSFVIFGKPLDSLLVFHYPSNFFTASFSGQCLLDAFLLARLQVKGVFLHFLDDIFLLNLPLETPKRILYRLTVLNADFGQLNTPPIRYR